MTTLCSNCNKPLTKGVMSPTLDKKRRNQCFECAREWMGDMINLKSKCCLASVTLNKKAFLAEEVFICDKCNTFCKILDTKLDSKKKRLTPLKSGNGSGGCLKCGCQSDIAHYRGCPELGIDVTPNRQSECSKNTPNTPKAKINRVKSCSGDVMKRNSIILKCPKCGITYGAIVYPPFPFPSRVSCQCGYEFIKTTSYSKSINYLKKGGE